MEKIFFISDAKSVERINDVLQQGGKVKMIVPVADDDIGPSAWVVVETEEEWKNY